MNESADAVRVPLTAEQPVFTFRRYLKERFGCNVFKVTLDAGFSCPNRDGRCGSGGCIYCNNDGFNMYSGGEARPSLREQYERGAAYMRGRFKATRFLPYFQAYTNTYAPLHELRAIYDTVMQLPGVAGLSVGTRPDCVDEAVLDLLESYAAPDRDVWVEYGLQSAHDCTLQRINRGHDVAAFERAMRLTEGRALKTCVHIILGLPGEDRAMMLATVDYLRQFACHGLKLHVLHVLRETPLEALYRQGEVALLELDDYVELVCDVLERVEPHVVIQRMSAEAPAPMLVAPTWCNDKALVRARIYSTFARRGSCQGQVCG